jgi:Spy/CpxP family protein refolding chaperone
MKWQNILLPFVTAIAVSSLQAQTPEASPVASPGSQQHSGYERARIWRKLNLTDAQTQQIRTIREDNGKTPAFRFALFAYLQAKKKVQDDIKAKQSVPKDDALALGVAEGQLGVLLTQQQNEIIKTVLSPEQQQTWNEFQAKRESFLQNRIESLKEPRAQAQVFCGDAEGFWPGTVTAGDP